MTINKIEIKTKELKIHTKEMILIALQELRDEYNPIIQNPMYRGSLEKHVLFTVKQIKEKVDRSVQTIRKWCKILTEENKLVMRWKKCYFANDSMTMEFRLKNAEIIKFRWK